MMSQILDDTAQPSAVDTHDDSGACACVSSANDNNVKNPIWLKNIFKKCAMCAGSGAGGLLVGHAGCIVTPLVIIAAGSTTAIATAFSIAITAGGLYAWHKLRGKDAEKWEKRLVAGGALTGVLLSSAFHMGDHHQNHKDFAPTSFCGKSPPPTIIHQP